MSTSMVMCPIMQHPWSYSHQLLVAWSHNCNLQAPADGAAAYGKKTQKRTNKRECSHPVGLTIKQVRRSAQQHQGTPALLECWSSTASTPSVMYWCPATSCQWRKVASFIAGYGASEGIACQLPTTFSCKSGLKSGRMHKTAASASQSVLGQEHTWGSGCCDTNAENQPSHVQHHTSRRRCNLDVEVTSKHPATPGSA
jgi:hypothetical protein